MPATTLNQIYFKDIQELNLMVANDKGDGTQKISQQQLDHL